MKLAEIIGKVDTLKKNQIEDDLKRQWISELDLLVFHEIILTHELPEILKGNETVQRFIENGGKESPYDENTDGETELLIPEPYSDVYFWWLASKIDLMELNSKQYKADLELYNNAYLTYQDYYNRTHMPVQKVRGFLCGSNCRADRR